MAVEEQIKVNFVGDISSLLGATTAIQKELTNFQKAASKVSTGDPFAGITTSAGKAIKSVSSIGIAIDSVDTRLKPPDFTALTTAIEKAKKDVSSFSLLPVKLPAITAPQIVIPPVKLPVIKLPTVPLHVDMNEYRRAVLEVKKDLSKITITKLPSLPPVSNPYKGATKGANEASQALINLSRVAQDAPYGFIGIANNLNPLLESFQRLKQTTGTTGGALKALGSSMLGSGGIGLALGVVSSLLVVFGDRLFGASNAADKTADDLEKARKATENYIATLSAVNQVRLEGMKAAQEELINADLLYKATQNQTLSLAERRKAVDALQQQYPSYFKNISDEVILAGGAEKAYNKLTTAILASARARAAQDKLVENAKKELDLDAQRAESLQKEYDARQKISDVIAKQNKQKAGSRVSDLSAAVDMGDLSKAQAEYNRQVETTTKLTKDLFKVQDDSRSLAEDLQSNISSNGLDVILPKVNELPKPKGNKAGKSGAFEFLMESIGFNPNGTLTNEQKEKLVKIGEDFTKTYQDTFEGLNFHLGAKTNDDVIKNAKKFWSDFSKGLIKFKPPKFEFDIEPKINVKDPDLKSTQEQLDKVFEQLKPKDPSLNTPEFKKSEILDNYSRLFKELGQKLPKTVTSDLGVKIKVGATTDLSGLENGLKDTYKRIEAISKSFNEQLRSLIQGGLVDLGVAFGESIGNAFSGAQGAFKGVAEVIGGFISQLGAALVKAGIAMVLAKKAFAEIVFSPGAAIAAGVGLVAVGQIIKNAVKVPHLKEGGIIPGGFEGDKFPAMLNSGEAVIPLNRLHEFTGGGNEASGFVASTLIRGNDLAVVINRTQRKQRRSA